MTTDGTADGPELASRLAAAVGGDAGSLSVVDAAASVDPTPDGAFASAVERDGTRLAEVYAHADRVRVEFPAAPDRAAAAADRAGLRVRPKAVRPPRTLVFVESPADVEPALAALEAAAEAAE